MVDIRKDDVPYDLHLMVDIVGYEKYLELCKMYGGSSVYFPVYRKAVMGERNRAILREYNGKNLDKLRVKYGVSKQQLKNILERS